MITIQSIQVGLPRKIGQADAPEPMDREWVSGFWKEPVAGSVRVTSTHLEGDGQADLSVHGGVEKAINVYPSEHYSGWIEELQLPEMPSGAFGENLTLSGLVEKEACIGDSFQVGGDDGILVQISQPRQPCWKLARRWKIKDLAARMERNGLTGWYFRVLREGQIRAGDSLTLTKRPYPQWTITEANRIMNRDKEDFASAAALADCPLLSSTWHEALKRRVDGQRSLTDKRRLNGPS